MVAYSGSGGKALVLLLFAAALIASSSALAVPSAISVRKASTNNGGNKIFYVQAKKQMISCREFALLANVPASSANEVDTENVDDDLDEFMKEMFEASATAAYSQDNAESMKELFQAPPPPNATDDTQNNKEVETAADNQPPPHFIQRENAVGIGGNDGFVYDVNKLKRNLVQESVRGCKQELLVLLGDGRQVVESKKDGKRKDNIVVPKWKKERDDLIEERLAGLVQTNPVSTTTDSNLLDGDWQFAFQTNSAKTILDTSRFLLSKTKRGSPNSSNKQTKDANKDVRGGPWRFRSGRTESPFRSSTRQVFLENLSADEDAHIIEKTSMFGGLFQISRRYGVYGLTRTALDLDLMESESKCFGFVLSKKGRSDFTGTKFGKPLEVQILYLDSDLCVSTTGEGLDGPVHIYTKGDLWVSGGAKRKVCYMTMQRAYVLPYMDWMMIYICTYDVC